MTDKRPAVDFRDPIEIHGVRFANRLLRSSVGGRTCNWDGTVTDVWKNFERRFADAGVGGIVSTTFHVNDKRLSPPQYPSLAESRHMLHLRRFLPAIRQDGRCRYIVQIGDPGYVTYSSLFPEPDDGLSASGGWDLGFGYNNRRAAMSDAQIRASINEHAAAALRAREAGADGIEITAGKGYLIHQFLNPAINRRDDEWGGSEDKRFRFFDEVQAAVRREVGDDFLVGVRLSGSDLNASPLPLALGRWPSPLRTAALRRGNDIDQMVRYGRLMKKVDYLHVVAGYGFPNPHDAAGAFPFDEIRMFFDSVRHLSRKAWWRAAAANGLAPVMRWLLTRGWDLSYRSLPLAAKFKSELPHMTVITNGVYETLDSIRQGLAQCDMVSMARALIANPDLISRYLRNDADVPVARRCTRCNRCVGRTTTSPLGCYDASRFRDTREMFRQIMDWNRPDPPPAEESRPRPCTAQSMSPPALE